MGTDSIVYIRTDGNSKIATGHLVRCLCIAQALEKLGQQVCFLVSDETSSQLLKELSHTLFDRVTFSFEIKILNSAVFDHLELEMEELQNLLRNTKSSFDRNKYPANDIVATKDTDFSQVIPKPTILVDSYYVTKDYLQALKSVAYVAYMDDLRAFDYDVDLVINYDVIPLTKEKEYKKAYTKAKICLLGAQYTPLREQFQNQKVILRDKIQNVLITAGGSDPYHFSESLSSFLLEENLDIHIHIVVGKLYDNVSTLEALSKEDSRIHLHHNIKDMASLMKKCDYAVSAAGTTLYELCALGIPAISFTFADNQMIMAKTFEETGAVPYAGDIRNTCVSDSTFDTNAVTENVYTNIIKPLKSMLQNYPKRIEQQQIMLQQTDGNGATKIAQAILDLSNR